MLHVGTFTPSVLLRVARRTGRLITEVDEVPVASSPAQFAALADGSLDAALTSPDNVLRHRGTIDVRVLSAIDQGMGLALYSRLEPAELRGKTFGVDVPTSGFALAMYAIAESLGLTRDDYELVALGSTPKRLTALRDGRCAATMLNAGNELHAEAAGFRVLGRAPQPYLGTVLVSRTDQDALAEALTATAAAICDRELDDEVIDEARTALRLTDELAARYLDRLTSPTEGLVRDGRVDPAAMATIEDLRRRYGTPS
ncbi:hypothetical protein AB0M20_06500 [Actinoplanes sp. NPDC051633]|uniref:ABC transporter substrate-binding protein n=1 Tax=Actinoplanes sp. NPDC051633 TaxID=3155670 RepID=UPI0034228493